MSKKHFVRIAALISDQLQNAPDEPTRRAVRDIGLELASVCAATNPAFDRSRFLSACGIK